MAGESTNALAFYQQLAAGLVLLPLLAAFRPTRPRARACIAAVAGLAFASTSLAYLLYFRLLAEVGPTSALTVTFLVPVFGVLWAVLFLGEHLGLGTVAGGALILVSVAFVTGTRLPLGRRAAVA